MGSLFAAAIPAVAGLAGGLMKSAGGNGPSTSSGSSSQAPWTPQQSFMTDGFDQAKTNLAQQNATPNYGGQLYQGTNDVQQTAINNAEGYAQSTGQTLQNNTANTSAALQAGANPWVNQAQNLAANGAGAHVDSGYGNTFRNIAANGSGMGSNPLSSALQTAGIAGARALGNGQSTLGAVQASAMADPTQSTISDAGQYANNPYLDGAIRAANQNTNNTLNEQTLPGLNRQATMGGNINSSRAGMAEAMANRDAATMNANTEATMRNQSYNSGLQLAAHQREAGMSAATSAATAANSTGNTAALGAGGLQQQAGQFSTQAQLQAAQGGAAADNTATGINAQTQLGGTAQLGAAVNAGTNAAQSAGSQANGLFNLANGAQTTQQTSQNQANQIAYQKYLADNGGQATSNLNNYWNIVGKPVGTQSTNSQSTQKPYNAIGQGLAIAQGTAGMMQDGGILSSNGGLFGNANEDYYRSGGSPKSF